MHADARLGVSPSKPYGWRAALCRCDCGQQITATIAGLLKGQYKSCGCLKLEAPHFQTPEVKAKHPRKHGLQKHTLYYTYYAMMRRCYREDDPHYPRWGGRGIRVWEPWHDVAAFIKGVEQEIGPRPLGKTLDRRDNDGNYEPGNVRWATAKEQAANHGPDCPCVAHSRNHLR